MIEVDQQNKSVEQIRTRIQTSQKYYRHNFILS